LLVTTVSVIMNKSDKLSVGYVNKHK